MRGIPGAGTREKPSARKIQGKTVLGTVGECVAGTRALISSNLYGAVSHLEAYVARLRQLRQIADDHAGTVRSDGMRALFATLHRELDDEYFEEISGHLKQMRFRAGVLISARLDRDNSGIGWLPDRPCPAGRTD